MDDIEIARAGPQDVDAIVRLLAANAPARGGSLTGEFPEAVVARWVAASMPVLAARDADGVVAVLFTAEKSYVAAPPVAAMLRAWPGAADAYVYGPVCIDARVRGRGVLERLYANLRAQLPGREAILFVRRDNAASLRAHARLGMHEVAGVALDGVEFAVLSDRPAAREAHR